MNLSELRRRSELGNRQAAKVLLARVHGLKLWLALWSVFGLMIVAIITALDDLLSFWPATLVSVAILISLLFVFPRANWMAPRLDTAALISSHLAKILDSLRIISKIFRPLGLSKRIKLDSPFYIHSKEHLIEMMENLKSQTKNPKTLADLDMAIFDSDIEL